MAAGCIETTQIITLNPDGSGRIRIDQVTAGLPPLALMGEPGDAKVDQDQRARQELGELLGKASGVEAWSQASCEALPDGGIHCKATGYFKDISKLDVMPGHQGNNDQPVRWAKNAKGGMELVLDDAKPRKAPTTAPAMPEDQVLALVKEEQARYREQKPMMGMFMSKIRIDLTFLLPGTVEESNNLKKIDHGVQLVIEGQKLLDVADKIMNDDNAVAAMVRTGQGTEEPPENFNELMFGSKGPIMARVAGDLKPQFDYAAEVATAKAGQDAMLKKLGVEIKVPPSPFGPATAPAP
jgi:hypothetical protein